MSQESQSAPQIFAAYFPEQQRIQLANASGVEIASLLCPIHYQERIVKQAQVEYSVNGKSLAIDAKLLNDGTVITVQNYMKDSERTSVPATSICAYDLEQSSYVVSRRVASGRRDGRSYTDVQFFEPASSTAITLSYDVRMGEFQDPENDEFKQAFGLQRHEKFKGSTLGVIHDVSDAIAAHYSTDQILKIYERGAPVISHGEDWGKTIRRMSHKGRNQFIPSETAEILLNRMTANERQALGLPGDILFRVKGGIALHARLLTDQEIASFSSFDPHASPDDPNRKIKGWPAVKREIDSLGPNLRRQNFVEVRASITSPEPPIS